MLEAVLFDLDDTLHDDTLAYRRAGERVAADVAAERNVSAERLFAAYIAEADAFWAGLSSANVGMPMVGLRAQMWLTALRAVGVEDEPLAVRCAAAYNAYRRDHLQLFPGALELLGRLRARGYKLGMITNGVAETHREKIVVLGLEEVFDEIFIADEVGLAKPDPRIFLLAAERLGVAPQRCAMVGDRYDRDVRGAQDAGMFTVFVNVRGESIPAGSPAPSATVETIVDVEAAIDRAHNG